jgi:type II secretory ATPase GspE/PulE/Tfp pilus assembly ATPase PilB-like protein
MRRCDNAGIGGAMIDKAQESPIAQDVVALVDDLLARAAAAGASDIHFEPGGGDMHIRLRLDGVLSTLERLPKAVGERVITRLKVIGGLLTYRLDIPQEGRIPPRGQRLLDQRLAVFPTIHGQRAVVRLFYDDPALCRLEQLGLDDQIVATLKQVAANGQGVVLLTGPAGSGKSTTMAALLRHIVTETPGRSIVAIEDPVERHLEGVVQAQVAATGMTFAVALRSLLRQDPQVLMIGEVRDAETARIVIESGLTGHLLMTTMHSGSPQGALVRLLEMGIEPYQVTSSVRAVVSQRLLRRLCPHCRRPRPEGGVAAVGCAECMQTGYSGRLLVAEMLVMTPDLRSAVLARQDVRQLRSVGPGGGSLRQRGLQLAQAGQTSVEEVDRICGHEE